MTVVVERDTSLVKSFREALAPDLIVVEAIDLLDHHLERHPDEHTVVLGPGVDIEAASLFAERSRIQRPMLGVILVRAQLDHDVLAGAMRSGMREVVEVDDLGGLAAAVERVQGLAVAISRKVDVAATAPDAPVRGSLLTVFSTKGGVGKSLVSINVAAALADRGHRVCVVDLDVHSGDVAIMLQLTPHHTLADLSQLTGGIDSSGMASLLTEHSANLSVLAAPVQLGAPVPADAIDRVLDVLMEMFDAVVVDTSGAFDDYALPAIDRSDLLVLVGTLDIPALKSLKLTAGTLDLLNVSRQRWRVLLNRADAKVGLSAKEFAETLGVEVAASVPSSRDVLAAVNRGEAIVRANPGHQVSKILAAFAASLAPDAAPVLHATQPSASAESEPKATTRRGLRLRKVG
ncbi:MULTISPECIES: AAA family ATPase [unclassified Nocardioides]|uniref:AAA family ATPase n=1 Tax=unclassified Nocardioides TaxID=2615069 RepID=UPI0036168B7D